MNLKTENEIKNDKNCIEHVNERRVKNPRRAFVRELSVAENAHFRSLFSRKIIFSMTFSAAEVEWMYLRPCDLSVGQFRVIYD